MALSTEDFGAYLHSFQDVNFAHAGFKAIGGPGLFGHVLARHEPDKVGQIGNRGKLKPRTVAMIQALSIMKKRNGGKANISLDSLLKMLANYVEHNNGDGFKDVQSLVGGDTRDDDEDDDTTESNKKVRRDQAERWRNYDPQYQ